MFFGNLASDSNKHKNHIDIKPMKAKSIILAILIASAGFSSCKKCIVCTIPGSGTVPASTQDFCSMKQADRDQLTNQYEKAGGSCAEK